METKEIIAQREHVLAAFKRPAQLALSVGEQIVGAGQVDQCDGPGHVPALIREVEAVDQNRVRHKPRMI